MTTRVVSVRKSEILKRNYNSIHDWLEEGNVYIGKAVPKLGIKCSKWLYGYLKSGSTDYKKYIIDYMYDQLDELIGKELGCYCRNGKDCHGYILLELLESREIENGMSSISIKECNTELQEIANGISCISIKECNCKLPCTCNAYRNWLMRNHGVTFEEEMARADKILGDKIFGRYVYKDYPQYTGEGY